MFATYALKPSKRQLSPQGHPMDHMTRLNRVSAAEFDREN